MINGNILNPPSNPYISRQLSIIQEMVNKSNSGNLIATDGSVIDIVPSALGTTIDFHGIKTTNNEFYVVLVDSGPSGEEDFTDSRYWAQSIIIGQEANSSQNDIASVYIDQTANLWYGVVHNVDEMSTGTHSLPVYSGDRTQAVLSMPLYTVKQIDAAKRSTEPTTDFANSLFVFKGGFEAIRDAQITSSTAVNGVIQYIYTIQLGRWTEATLSSPGTFVADSSTNTYAYNSAEGLNTFTGSNTVGTGNTVASDTGIVNGGSCTFLPLPDNGYVEVKYRSVDIDGNQYYTIINAMNSAE